LVNIEMPLTAYEAAKRGDFARIIAVSNALVYPSAQAYMSWYPVA
jgi:hypothetical protein